MWKFHILKKNNKKNKVKLIWISIYVSLKSQKKPTLKMIVLNNKACTTIFLRQNSPKQNSKILHNSIKYSQKNKSINRTSFQCSPLENSLSCSLSSKNQNISTPIIKHNTQSQWSSTEASPFSFKLPESRKLIIRLEFCSARLNLLNTCLTT